MVNLMVAWSRLISISTGETGDISAYIPVEEGDHEVSLEEISAA